MPPASAAAVALDRRIAQEDIGRRPQAKGKFLFRGEEKCFLRGVSYGPFAPAAHGTQFPERDMVLRDFALMRDAGVNCFRTFTPPPEWLLDLAGDNDLVVLTGIPWTEHVAFLDEPGVAAEIRTSVENAVKALHGHPALFAMLIGNEIPSDIVRWHGPERTREFMHELFDLAKNITPETLVSYANFPPTEYLDLDFLDFISFNVYLHREHDFRSYVSRLQNLAKDKPLVLTEFGIDSIREGDAEQAEILSWQVRAAFESGVAGAVVFAWTDDWFTGGFQVEDWAFGLVDRARHKKPSYHSVQKIYAGQLPPPLPNPPRFSVVICAYNAETTMDACMRSLRELRYPNYEIVVVDDGSTDSTRAIAERYPEARIISQPNKGLSVARNVGAEAALGDIIAYTDSDCVVDPDWLTYLAYKFEYGGFVSVGGPNLPPPEDALIPACVAASPGGPTHVLLNDEVAEHIPGCNMAFRRSALQAVDGFDPVYRAAGDDVDLCWRLQNLGHPIGFSPAAMVWHFRRNTIRAYLKQQMGYGKAEALLYFKHPYRFNLLGQSQWLGRIYGDFTGALFSRRPVIYHGVFGRGLFQTLYEAPSSLLSYIPFTLEWNVVGLVLLLGSLLAGRYLFLASAPLLISVVWAVATAWRARLEPRYDLFRSRLLITALVYLGPLVRSAQRYLWRLQGMRPVERISLETPSQKPKVQWAARRFFLSYWSEDGREKEHLLGALMEFLVVRKHLVAIDQGWNDWDIEVYRGVWTTADLKLAVENHGGAKRFFRARCGIRLSFLAKMSLLACGAVLSLGLFLRAPEIAEVAGLLGAINLGVVIYECLRLGRVMYHAQEIVAKSIGLSPVLEPVVGK
ncbi:MAG: glycosyltransferase [Deltaproteobacteria bacterium]|nr:glycosyltransferase [Deltaproteobacteria bacterium]MBI3386326.1 glycosyltransferase [Deltaproteobacteria bacterium]